MFNVGMPEMVVIAGVTLLVYGPQRSMELAQQLGKAVKDFKKAAAGEGESEIPVTPAPGTEARQ